eukprot:3493042-Pleurochrysis_carterae.AAC.1
MRGRASGIDKVELKERRTILGGGRAGVRRMAEVQGVVEEGGRAARVMARGGDGTGWEKERARERGETETEAYVHTDIQAESQTDRRIVSERDEAREREGEKGPRPHAAADAPASPHPPLARQAQAATDVEGWSDVDADDDVSCTDVLCNRALNMKQIQACVAMMLRDEVEARSGAGAGADADYGLGVGADADY